MEDLWQEITNILMAPRTVTVAEETAVPAPKTPKRDPVPRKPAFEDTAVFEVLREAFEQEGRVPSVREIYELMNRRGGFRRILRLRQQFEITVELRDPEDLPTARRVAVRRIGLLTERLEAVAARIPDAGVTAASPVTAEPDRRISSLLNQVDALASVARQILHVVLRNSEPRSEKPERGRELKIEAAIEAGVGKHLQPLEVLKPMAAQLAKASAVRDDARNAIERTQQVLASLETVASRLEAGSQIRQQIEATVSQESLEQALVVAVQRGIEIGRLGDSSSRSEIQHALAHGLGKVQAQISSLSGSMTRHALPFADALRHLAASQVAQVDLMEAVHEQTLDAVGRLRRSTAAVRKSVSPASQRRKPTGMVRRARAPKLSGKKPARLKPRSKRHLPAKPVRSNKRR